MAWLILHIMWFGLYVTNEYIIKQRRLDNIGKCDGYESIENKSITIDTTKSKGLIADVFKENEILIMIQLNL